MSKPRVDVRPVIVRIEDILRDLAAGRFRVPSFARSNWRSAEIISFLDSLYRGFPVGTLLANQHAAPASTVMFGPVVIDAPARTDAWLIVDGHQRLAALAGVFLHPERLPCGDQHAIWFDLESEQFERLALGSPPLTWIPVNVTGDSHKLLSWLRAWPLQGERPELVERALHLSRTLREGPLAVYVLLDAGDEALREAFVKTNTAGVSLRAAELFDAVHPSTRTLADVGSALEQEGFGQLPMDWLLQALGLVAGKQVRPGSVELALVQQTEAALRRTINFLRVDAGIPHIALLPYRLPLFVLTRFFHLHPKISARSTTLLARWLWRGASSQEHAAWNWSVAAAIRDLSWGLRGNEVEDVQSLLKSIEDWSLHVDLGAAWNKRTAATRLVALALRALNPLDPWTQAPINFDESAWAEFGAFAVAPFNHRSNGDCLLLSRAGRPLNAAERREAFDLLSRASPAVLASHALSDEAVAALAAGNRTRWTFARQRCLESFFWARTGGLRDDRPSIDFLVRRAHQAMAS